MKIFCVLFLCAFLALPASAAPKLETAVFAGGCFWGMEAVFEHTRGVASVQSGYAGGPAAFASYDKVSTGLTGHAEAVRILFDPSQVSYGQLLSVFFASHDATQVNRQGPDRGSQYRTEIFTTSPAQLAAAKAYVKVAQSRYRQPIATRIAPLRGFFLAESYHQDYLANHPNDPYIKMFDQPKLASLQKQFPALYKP